MAGLQGHRRRPRLGPLRVGPACGSGRLLRLGGRQRHPAGGGSRIRTITAFSASTGSRRGRARRDRRPVARGPGAGRRGGSRPESARPGEERGAVRHRSGGPRSDRSSASVKTHFEQIQERAMAAMDNAVSTCDYANQLTEMIRRTQDDSDDIVYSGNFDQEIDFKNRLIEIFGYPYEDDIGPTGTYPDGLRRSGRLPLHVRRRDRPHGRAGPGSRRSSRRRSSRMPNGIGHFDFQPNRRPAPMPFDHGRLCPGRESDRDARRRPTTLRPRSAAAPRPETRPSPTRSSSSSRRVGKLDAPRSRRAAGASSRSSSLAMNSYEQVLTEYNNTLRTSSRWPT